jgi:hypothetical protein
LWVRKAKGFKLPKNASTPKHQGERTCLMAEIKREERLGEGRLAVD